MADEKKSESIKVAASSAAAIAAAFIGSRFGVSGTILGAGITSVVSMGGTTVVQHSLERTQVKLKRRLAAGKTRPDGTQEPPTIVMAPVVVDRPLAQQGHRFGWKWALTGIAAVFLITMGILTVVELGTGKPISGGNEGTTLTGLFGSPTSHKVVPTTVTQLITPTVTQEPSSTFSEPSSVLPTTTTPSELSGSETMTTSPLLTTTVVPPPTTQPALIPSVG